ncbi:hypothetical protein GCM10009558_037650 [Virgisporangium aurantiacum]
MEKADGCGRHGADRRGRVDAGGRGPDAIADFGLSTNWFYDNPRFVADITGEGRADVVGFGPQGVYVAVANADGSFGSVNLAVNNLGFNQGWRRNEHPRWVQDITGDGRADVVGIGFAGVWTAVSHGDGTFGPATFVLEKFGLRDRQQDTKLFLADTNNDKCDDIVSIYNSQTLVSLADCAGGYAQPTLATTVFDFFNFDWRYFQVADVTGDGRAEILAATTFGDLGPIQLVISTRRADGTYNNPVPAGANFPNGAVAVPTRENLVDVTNDGRRDLVLFDAPVPEWGVYTARAQAGAHFADFIRATPDFGGNQGWTPNRHLRLVADLNDDGRGDIVGFGEDGVYTALATTGGMFATPNHMVLPQFGANAGWDWNIDTPRVLADINGDRRADIVAFGTGGVYTAISNGDGTFAA